MPSKRGKTLKVWVGVGEVFDLVWKEEVKLKLKIASVWGKCTYGSSTTVRTTTRNYMNKPASLGGITWREIWNL